MSFPKTLLLATLIGQSWCSPWVFAQEVQSDESAVVATDAKTSVSKAIGYLKEDGQSWITKKQCVSCHQVPAMLWSLSAAEANGFAVGEGGDQLQRWQDWSTQFLHFVAPKDREGADSESTLSKNIDTMAALLLAIPEVDGDGGDDGDDGDEEKAWREKFIQNFCDNQNADGSWSPQGQLPMQKRALAETEQATTLWVVLSLLRHQSPGSNLSEKYDLNSALEFVDDHFVQDGSIDGNAKPAGTTLQSTEWWAVRLLVADQLEQTVIVGKVREHLVQRQNDDGGWGWVLGSESDALATGLALYALRYTNQNAKPTTERAQQFLVSTQQANGSWKVPGTKKSSKDRTTPTANYWGTAWAVIGLLQADLDDPGH